ncbi:metallophosphoesterase [Undibacterium sp. Jales W-56]|uniref:metallophosphoesterase family protein n=1 Tax=Undibacterium sp. Jales W-56 TaxID=2897325 RepID=UPI0021CF458F|nr:metallophosphoesterase [Undibacterium sp. Jales W-56]MCU6432521.1 metallophosphoesterase [Undibacterium sp. Jales W-56]
MSIIRIPAPACALHSFIATLTACSALSLASLAPAAETAHPSRAKSPAPKSVTVYVAGDIADCRKKPYTESMAEKTAELIEAGLANDPKAVALTLGDNTYPIGKPEEFSQCYDPTWGRFKARTLPSPGNHDYGMPSAHGYYNYFGDLAGPERRGYYSRKVGHWQVLSLNSNIDGAQMQAQLQWLKEELSNNPSRCTLAFWHHPVFSTGGHGSNNIMQAAWKLLVDAKADIVLASHDHDYERFVPLDEHGNIDQKNGLRSFVVGTGGARLTPMFFPKIITEIRDNATYGVLKLSLHEKSYDWEFLPVAGQTFTDKGSATCH